MYKLLLFFVVFALFSCNDNQGLETQIESIYVDVTIDRFDQEFANLSIETIAELKQKYPFMFSKNEPDSSIISRSKNIYNQKLATAIKHKFNTPQVLKTELTSLFKHLKYYYKDFKVPRVITYTDFVDYNNKVFVNDSIVLIGLDNYLGKSNELYDGIHAYIAETLEPNQIAPNLAFAYAEKKVGFKTRKTFLDEMIYYGKLYYFVSKMLPNQFDNVIIGYNKDDINWAKTNEINIWAYFIEHQLFYDTSPKLVLKFINPAPFSRFGLELDTDSPGRIGRYIGWQIVNSYMKNNSSSLNDLMTKSTEEIFNNAKYKPKSNE